MKNKFIALLSVAILQGCAALCTGGWTPADTALELASQGLLIKDWHQTIQIAQRPDTLHETNLILGLHPSVGRVNTYFALWLPLHAGVSCILPQPFRRIWQGGTIAIEAPVILNNERLLKR